MSKLFPLRVESSLAGHRRPGKKPWCRKICFPLAKMVEKCGDEPIHLKIWTIQPHTCNTGYNTAAMKVVNCEWSWMKVYASPIYWNAVDIRATGWYSAEQIISFKNWSHCEWASVLKHVKGREKNLPKFTEFTFWPGLGLPSQAQAKK